MKYLQGLNLVLLGAASVMSLVLAVVCLMLAVHHEAAGEIGVHLQPAATATGVFLLWAVAAALAVWGIHRDTLWKWLAQAGLVAITVLLVLYLRNLG